MWMLVIIRVVVMKVILVVVFVPLRLERVLICVRLIIGMTGLVVRNVKIHHIHHVEEMTKTAIFVKMFNAKYVIHLIQVVALSAVHMQL
jgi:hypothetical protein